MSFKETLAAHNLDLAKIDEAFKQEKQKFKTAKKDFDEASRLYAEIRPKGFDVADLVRRYGPKAAGWIGGPIAGVGATALITDDGGFTGLFENFKLIGQVLGLLPGL